MSPATDNDLLAEFTRTESQAAFSSLVERYINLVYATALRFTKNPHHAEEITQVVFIILARKAPSLGRGVVLSGWLYQTARLTSANFLKSEFRRQRREQEAYMQSTLTETTLENWEQIAPFLDEAMGQLSETDHTAIVLRYFENKSTSQVADVLKMKEAAAHKRVNRALEKLRKLFGRRGVTFTVAAIAGLIGANSVPAAPVGLAKTIPVAVLGKGAATGASTLVLAKGTIKVMAWLKMKTAVYIGTGLILTAGTAAAVYETIWQDPFGKHDQLATAPATLIIRPSTYTNGDYPSGVNMGTADGKWVYTAATMPALLGLAYHYSQERMILPTNLPTGRYDLMLTLQDHQAEALRKQLNEQFGIAAQHETQEVEVLLLKIGDRNKLETHRFKDLPTAVKNNGHKVPGLLDARTFDLEQALGMYLGKPVVDDTGSSNEDYFSFDYDFLNQKPDAFDTKLNNVRQTCLDQAGLELVPAKRPIEMLVVSRLKN